MKLFIILIAMVGMGAGALHAYQKRNLLIQAAMYSEAFLLSTPVKARVSDHYVQHSIMPHDNTEVELGVPKSIYGTSVKRVSVQRSGLVMVDFADEIGEQSLLFTPSVSPISGLLEWRCTSDSIDRKVLELLKPVCHHTPSTNEGKLINAIANGKLEVVRQLLTAGANPDAVVNGNSPLMLAAKMGNIDIVKLLVSKGASVDNNALNSERRTPLMVAINSNNADVVGYLLANGASVTRRDYKGLTAQDHAVNTDRRLSGERYELMVLARLNPNFAGKPQRKGTNKRSGAQQAAHLEGLFAQLTTAARDCHVQRLATLLQEEKDYNSPEMIDGKPLSTYITKPACSAKLTEFIRAKKSYQHGLEARFNRANDSCDLKTIDSLLRDNPELDLLGTDRLRSHFDRAIFAGCSKLVSFYIRDHGLGDKIDGSHLLNAIRKAPTAKQVELVGTMLAAGVDVNFRDDHDETPLEVAIALEQPVVAKYLVDAGADVSAPTVNGSYPIIEASKKGFNHLVSQLINQGADINQQDAMGRTALVAAVAKGRRRLVDTLLRSGADPVQKDRDGISAVMLAESLNFKQIYSQLTASASIDN